VIRSTDPKAWQEARNLWLQRLGSPHTRLAYETSLNQLEKFTRKGIWEISRADINRWMASLQKAEKSPSTLANRLVAIRAFYKFVAEENITMDKAGQEFTLRTDNPAVGIRAPKVDAYGKAMCLDQEQAKAILDAIDRGCPAGKRDYTLYLGYMLMGLRNSELRLLKYEDIQNLEDRKIMRYLSKGGREERQEIFPPVYEAIMEYALSEGHYAGYVFHSYDNSSNIVDRPICEQTVRDNLRRYARKAGIRAEHLKVHSLRHTAEYLRMQAGEDLSSARTFLKHSDERTTSIYRQNLKPEPDKTWMTVSEFLGTGKGQLR
jgi:site-specific recombinase XerD